MGLYGDAYITGSLSSLMIDLVSLLVWYLVWSIMITEEDYYKSEMILFVNQTDNDSK